jgi:hypothetical protein
LPHLNLPHSIADTIYRDLRNNRPNTPFGDSWTIVFDMELIEETAGVFDNMIFDINGTNDTGFVLIEEAENDK